MKILVTGALGFIGKNIIDSLLKENFDVISVDLSISDCKIRSFKLDLTREKIPQEILEKVDGIIHLAGKNIFGRWNKKIKEEIYRSRIVSTRNIFESLKDLNRKPKFFITASAVGYYGDRGEEELVETSSAGEGFLAKVCVDWEREAKQVESLGIRSVQIRKGIVLGNGGLIARLLPIYRLGVDGILGDGRQWFPWIHIKDVVNIYIFSIKNEKVSGPIIASSPQQIRYEQFARTFNKLLNKSFLFKIPKIFLKIAFGELSNEILSSQKVYPQKLISLGYKFLFTDIESALADVLKNYLTSREI